MADRPRRREVAGVGNINNRITDNIVRVGLNYQFPLI
jgi:hypothetical protein